MSTQIQIVQFYDSDLPCAVIDGEPCVSVRRIAEAIGLAVNHAVSDVQKDEILKDEVRVCVHRDSLDREVSMVMLAIRFLPGWLLGIKSGRVRPEARERLLLFKRECYDVLYRHFFGDPKETSDRHRAELMLHRERRELVARISADKARVRQIDHTLDLMRQSVVGQLNLSLN